jgi:histidine ammonia-lyase
MAGEIPLAIDGASLDIPGLVAVARERRRASVADGARARMERSRAWVEAAAASPDAIYGVNTGFGSLARVRIDPALSSKLSSNLVRSHAAGVGEPLGEDVVRAMMLLRANALARGASGCQPAIVDTLVAMLNAGVVPVVPSQGSCGSSGDLAPLSHLGLVIMEGPAGEAWFQGERLPAREAMARAEIPRLTLGAKDGLAITNGAQATTALLALAVHDATVLVHDAEVAAALSIEALLGATRAFHPSVHAQRPYAGAIASAAHLRALLAGSTLTDSVPGKVQDAYSLRCTPTVLGAVRDAIAHVAAQVQIELNATTDNPLVLVDEESPNKAFGAGLFHGEPMGLCADYLRTAVGELASIAERRLYRLTTGNLSARLPPALASKDRPELGWLLPQTTAAALVSEIKSLGWPASLDSIPTCEDQEDHVAMSTTAARRAAEVILCARRVIAIEVLGAVQALAMRRDEAPGVRLGRGTGVAVALFESTARNRATTPSEAIAEIETFLARGSLQEALR